jgi:cation transport regulator
LARWQAVCVFFWIGGVAQDTAIKENAMPYERKSELPKGVRDNLPAHAQDIYKEAYNSAYDEYNHDEERASRVAWGAVKKQYHKNDEGNWVKGASRDER